MLSAKRLQKSYDQQKILDGFSLDFDEGKTHVLLGSSGCGKTTVLRIIMGLIQAEGGEVYYQNQERRSFKPNDWVSHFGYMPQNGGLFPHLTNWQNISLKAKLLGWSKEKINKRMDELLESIPIDRNLLEKIPSKLSGGQRQRISLLRALFLDPKILTFDEPFSALDPIIRYELQDEFKKLFQRLQKTVIWVTHDLFEANYLAHKMTFIHQGKVLQTGIIDDFVNKPKNDFITQFLNAQRSWSSS